MASTQYSFIKSFGLTRFIFNDANSIDAIVNILKSSLNEKQIRNIIHFGINSYTKSANNYECVNKILRKVHDNSRNNQSTKASANKRKWEKKWNSKKKKSHKHSQQKNSNSRNTKHKYKYRQNGSHNSINSYKYCQQVFKIKNIACNIFKYLDFESKNDCKTVCISWLYDLYHRASNDSLDVSDLFKIESNYQDTDDFGLIVGLELSNISGTINDLSNYHNIRDIKLREWPSDLNKHFQSFGTKFNRIEKITFNQTKDYEMFEFDNNADEAENFGYLNPTGCSSTFEFDPKYPSIINNLIKNNCDTVKVIDINLGQYDGYGHRLPESLSKILHTTHKIRNLLTNLEQFNIQPQTKFRKDKNLIDFIEIVSDMHLQIRANGRHSGKRKRRKTKMQDCGVMILQPDRMVNFDLQLRPNTIETPAISKKYKKALVDMIYDTWKKRKIKLLIKIGIDSYSYRMRGINSPTEIKVVVDQMNRLNMIHCCLEDVDPIKFDKRKIRAKWNGDFRWYYDTIHQKYVCQLFSCQIQLIQTASWLEIKINYPMENQHGW